MRSIRDLNSCNIKMYVDRHAYSIFLYTVDIVRAILIIFYVSYIKRNTESILCNIIMIGSLCVLIINL